jgi:hypothetical protein
MFKHLFGYISKIHVKSREGFLFSLFLPFALGLVFLFAFEGLAIDENHRFDPVKVAVSIQGNDWEQKEVQAFLNQVGIKGKLENEEIIQENASANENGKYILYYFGEEATVQKLLEEGKIDAKVDVDNRDYQMAISLYIHPLKANDISSQVVYQVFSSFNNSYHTVKDATRRLTIQAFQGRNLSFVEPLVNRVKTLSSEDVYVNEYKERINPEAHYFFVSLAYICLYFMRIGIRIIRGNEGYSGPTSKRLTMSPVGMGKRVFTGFVSLTIPSLALMYLLLFMYWQKNVGLSTDYGSVILLISLGTLLSIFMGMAFASLFKMTDDRADGISFAIPITGALLGGLMGAVSLQLKIWIGENLPFLNILYPVSLVTDGLYQLSLYPTYHQFYQTIGYLMIYLVILAALIAIGIRRVKE